MNPSSERIAEVVSLIIESLNLKHLNSGEMNADTSLYDGGLELDSIDVLELVVALEQKYRVKIENAEQGKEIFQTIGSIAQFVDQSAKSA